MSTAYGTAYNIGQGQYRSAVSVWATNTTETTVKYSVKIWGQLKNIDGWNPSELWFGKDWNGSSYSWGQHRSGNMYCAWSSNWNDTNFVSQGDNWTATRTHSTQRIWYAARVNCAGGTFSHAQTYIDIPARPSYSVTYNANGGTGAPSTDTKWYGETLTLSKTKPTRSGYDFLGWATSSGGSVSYSAGGSYTGNSGLALYAVWKPQASTITSVTDITLGNAPTVKWTPLLDTFKYKITYSIGSWSYTTAFISPASTSEQTYSGYAIPTSVANQITTATTGTINCVLETYDSSGTLLGSNSKQFTATVPSSLKPTLTASLSPTGDNTTVNSWGIYVAGYSKVRCRATGTAQQGASIVSVQITGTVNANSSTSTIDYTTGVLTAGDKTFTFTVTDSRGMTSTAVTQTARFMSYSAPEITSFNAHRKDAPNITVVQALATWTWTEIGNNTITKSLQYRQSTASSWTNVSGTISSGTTKTLSEIFTDSASYYLKLTITDSLNNASVVTVYIPTVFVWEHMPPNGLGVAFGKTSETGDFEINYDLEVYGSENLTGDLAVGGDGAFTGDVTGDGATFNDITSGTLTVATIDHTITSAQYLELARLLADTYSVTADYFVGEFCKNGSNIYECNSPIVGGEAWNASHWTLLGSA